MRKLILAAILTIAMAVPAMATEVFAINGLNVQGDVLYLFSEGEFAVGVGTTLATFYDVVEVRGHFVDPLPDAIPNKAGVGLGVNIVKVIGKLGGSWLVETLNPSVGITALTNLSGTAHIEPAAYFSAIDYRF